MKNILIVAYYYPPMGGAGVQRIAKFAKYLSKFGYNINVLTVEENSNSLVDRSLNEDIEESIKVHRTVAGNIGFLSKIINIYTNKSSKESNNEALKIEVESPKVKNKLKSIIRSIAKKVFFAVFYLTNIPDDKKNWISPAVIAGGNIIKQENIDLIISTSAPYSTHEIAYQLSKKYKLKWIADFRDPWVSNAFANYNWLLKTIYKRYEKTYIENADKVISVSSPIIDDFISRYSMVDNLKFHVIPNGYDESDFINCDKETQCVNDRFTILYNGTLYGIESPESFLEALENLIKAGKVEKDKLLVRFVGRTGHDQKLMINEFTSKYPGLIEIKGFMPHKENIKELVKADALLLIINEGKGTEGVFTGKIFEYIRTGKRVLGIVPKGVARDLIVETNTGYVAHSDKIHENEEMIYSAYIDFLDKNHNEGIRWDIIEKYSRENLSLKLSEIIEEL